MIEHKVKNKLPRSTFSWHFQFYNKNVSPQCEFSWINLSHKVRG